MRKIYTHAVVLGMGGSSLAPDVLRETFGHVAGYPQLHVLDSSDPVQVARLEASLDLAHTLFIVASKSGTTTEPEAFFRYFYERVQKTVGADSAGKQFVAITDPDTQLGKEAKDAGFARIFENDPAIGGRYSALSYFGMVPAALAGYDVATILDRGLGELAASDRSTKVADSEAVRFGATIGTLAKNGRDKLTIVAHPEVAAFGAWAEQLVAESTGKSGTGIVPIEGETLGMPSEYDSDRVFVYVGAGLPADEHLIGAMDGGAIETRLHMLEEAGHPVIRLGMNDRLDIGEQFALWEVAVATAGAVLGIDAFDQPNVQESKDNTKRLLAEYKQDGQLPGTPGETDDGRRARHPDFRLERHRARRRSLVGARRVARAAQARRLRRVHRVRRPVARSRTPVARYSPQGARCVEGRDDRRLRSALPALDGSTPQGRPEHRHLHPDHGGHEQKTRICRSRAW